jgi:acyl-coenzyme A thioesterase PaaI-like protein
VVSDAERATLVRLTKRRRVNRAIAFRARIVLACIEQSDTAVARHLRVTKTVAKWRISSWRDDSRDCMTSPASARLARSPTSRLKPSL